MNEINRECRNLERFDRRSSGRRNISENRRARLLEYENRNANNNYHPSKQENGKSTSKRKHKYNEREFSKDRKKYIKKRESESSNSWFLSSNSPRSRSNKEVQNDEKGHLIFHSGDWIRDRYKTTCLLGEGAFGRCIKCWDSSRHQSLALKVIRDVEKYRDAAKLEIQVLKTIAKNDKDNSSLCIHMLKWFNYHGHVCIVFPCLGKSVYDFLKSNEYQPFTLIQVKHIALQLLSAVKFLHRLKLTHTDLKLENMLFVNSDYELCVDYNLSKKYKHILNTDIRLIDFGSATFSYEHHSSIVCTRHYRPPEVILQLNWDYSCDMWGIGCIIYELYTGNAMFMTHNNHEHLAMMEAILGPIPISLINQTQKTYFSHGKLNWDIKDSTSNYVRDNCVPLKESFEYKNPNHFEVFDLTQKLLTYEPEKRLTAEQALNHSLFYDFNCTFFHSKQ